MDKLKIVLASLLLAACSSNQLPVPTSGSIEPLTAGYCGEDALVEIDCLLSGETHWQWWIVDFSATHPHPMSDVPNGTPLPVCGDK